MAILTYVTYNKFNDIHKIVSFQTGINDIHENVSFQKSHNVESGWQSEYAIILSHLAFHTGPALYYQELCYAQNLK